MKSKLPYLNKNVECIKIFAD